MGKNYPDLSIGIGTPLFIAEESYSPTRNKVHLERPILTIGYTLVGFGFLLQKMTFILNDLALYIID